MASHWLGKYLRDTSKEQAYQESFHLYRRCSCCCCVTSLYLLALAESIVSLTYAVPRERAAEYLQPRLLASLGPLSAWPWPSLGPSLLGGPRQARWATGNRSLSESLSPVAPTTAGSVGFRVRLGELVLLARLGNDYPVQDAKGFNEDGHGGSVAPAPEDQNIQVRTNAPTCMPLGLGMYSQVKRVRRLWSSRTAKGGLITHIALHNRGARSGFLDDIESDSQWETRQG